LGDIKINETRCKTPELVSLVRSVGVFIAVTVLLPLLAVAAEPDVLISTSGEKFVGELESATAAEVTFKSQAAGEITVSWSKVKELHSTRRFVVIPKNVKISGGEDVKRIPEGAISADNKRIEIKPAPQAAARTVSIADSGHVVDEKSFQRSFKSPGFFGGWSPSISAGTSMVFATQHDRTVDSEVTLTRVVPDVDWRNTSDRTTIDLSASYSKTHSTLATNPATVKAYIYQADLEREQYLVPRLFGYGEMTYDHNYSQNLSMAQTYVGGLGLAIWKRAGQELDLKGSLGYIQRRYYMRGFDKNLFASTFGESYRNKRKHGIEFHEELFFIPAWNDSPAYAAAGKAGLSIPISQSFSLDFNAKDSFLHGVPAAYKKNSVEFSVDLSYSP
jgi:Protein of unknown function, DUF481